MTLLVLHISHFWLRLCRHLGLSFDLAGIGLDDVELEQQLGFGRD